MHAYAQGKPILDGYRCFQCWKMDGKMHCKNLNIWQNFVTKCIKEPRSLTKEEEQKISAQYWKCKDMYVFASVYQYDVFL